MKRGRKPYASIKESRQRCIDCKQLLTLDNGIPLSHSGTNRAYYAARCRACHAVQAYRYTWTRRTPEAIMDEIRRKRVHLAILEGILDDATNTPEK